ncbi:MAG: NAD(P)-dependent dehydrogenase (short-subunit alcohol dehydrogenase family) [Arenicella sp.]|jgi:NAD(P)-dependent dehydrogenase (short-subunit alcohol dehydrogenase family)
MRRILITGANKGIGLASVAAIVSQRVDTQVLIGSRNRERGLQARASLLELHPSWGDRLEVVEVDVSNDESVAKAVAEVQSKFDGDSPLYAVVNNAGVGASAGDLEYVLQVNARGVRRVCEAFLPLIDAQKGRIVNVTSASGPNFVSGCSKKQQSLLLDADIDWSILDAFMNDCVATEGEAAFAVKGLSSGEAYGLSKACANSYTLLVARQHPNLRINACTPGFIETDMTRPLAIEQGVAPTEMGMKRPAEGTSSILHLLFGELDGNGHYYGSDAVRSPMHCYRVPGDPPYTGE